MGKFLSIFFSFIFLTLTYSCSDSKGDDKKQLETPLASDLLGDSNTLAISYGSFRLKSRDFPPSVEEIKEDLLILNAMGFHFLRTYHSQTFEDTKRVLEAIEELNKSVKDFKMYLMLGVWMECKDARTDSSNHQLANFENNTKEIEAAISFANQYPKIVKVIAVGNESMVHWSPYHLHPKFILHEVLKLQKLKMNGGLPREIWITSSDNFAAWGGGSTVYHSATLDSLINAVDFLSIHTYPFHDTHYNSSFWILNDTLKRSYSLDQLDSAMQIAADYAKSQYNAVIEYQKSLGAKKEVHIGETGWATNDNALYGKDGSGAADEYKQKLYYEKIRNWSAKNGISCFFFEAFDEPWKDSSNPSGSENHFGLFTVDGHAKYVMWEYVDDRLKAFGRNGKNVEKTFNGSDSILMKSIIRQRFY